MNNIYSDWEHACDMIGDENATGFMLSAHSEAVVQKVIGCLEAEYEVSCLKHARVGFLLEMLDLVDILDLFIEHSEKDYVWGVVDEIVYQWQDLEVEQEDSYLQVVIDRNKPWVL